MTNHTFVTLNNGIKMPVLGRRWTASPVSSPQDAGGCAAVGDSDETMEQYLK